MYCRTAFIKDHDRLIESRIDGKLQHPVGIASTRSLATEMPVSPNKPAVSIRIWMEYRIEDRFDDALGTTRLRNASATVDLPSFLCRPVASESPPLDRGGTYDPEKSEVPQLVQSRQVMIPEHPMVTHRWPEAHGWPELLDASHEGLASHNKGFR